MRNQLVEFQNGEEQVSRNLRESGLVMLTAIPEVAPTNFLLFSISIFLLEQAGSAGAAHTTGRDCVASDSKSVLWRTTNPQPRASDLTLELDQY